MVSRAILATWRRFLRQRRYLHELGELSSMDDLSLRDIGISRCEVRAAIRTRSDLMRRGSCRWKFETSGEINA